MLKRKSNPWARLKYLYVLPLTAVAVVALPVPKSLVNWERFQVPKLAKLFRLRKLSSLKAEPVVEVVPPVEKPAIKEVVASAPQVVKVIKVEARANKDSIVQEKKIRKFVGGYAAGTG